MPAELAESRKRFSEKSFNSKLNKTNSCLNINEIIPVQLKNVESNIKKTSSCSNKNKFMPNAALFDAKQIQSTNGDELFNDNIFENFEKNINKYNQRQILT